MIEQGLIPVLASITDRLYPRVPQRAVFPLIRYQRITTQRSVTVGAERTGPTEFTLQIDCMARTYGGAKGLAKQVADILHTYRGPWGNYHCQLCMLESENDLDEQDGDDYTAWVSQRYAIYIHEG